ncbi:MAG: rhodanese-like domain-containing protein [Candidatus Eremiobacteraeota bacterium]|nr:rhodanese-like domain-containing protein [Candidatus Eremiobacteraeota bacterium]
MSAANEAGRAALAVIDVATLAGHIERGDAFVLDVRGGGHRAQVYGAIRYDPKKLLEAERLVLPLPKSEGLIVLYDDDGSSGRLSQIAQKLRDDGYAEVRALEGGYAAWEAADGRTEERTMEQPVPLVSEHQINR